jgi:hypothetical protein
MALKKDHLIFPSPDSYFLPEVVPRGINNVIKDKDRHEPMIPKGKNQN